MQNFQVGFELKSFEVGKIVAIGISMRIYSSCLSVKISKSATKIILLA